MAYKSQEIFAKAKELIEQHNLFFIEDIVALLPCQKSTFYDLIKVDSNEMNILKGMLEKNKVALKVSMRKKWSDSEAPLLQLALMKIISTKEELAKLSMNHNVNTENEETVTITIE